MQTKRQSRIETLTQQAIGFIVAMVSQLIIFPVFDIHVSMADNLLIGIYFTIVSIIRSYVVRRMFNKSCIVDKEMIILNKTLHASNMQKDERILELQEHNITLQVENREMQDYIKKVDNIYE